jgi:hypothetical protein
MTSRYKWKKEIGRRKLYGKKNQDFDGSMRVIIIRSFSKIHSYKEGSRTELKT